MSRPRLLASLLALVLLASLNRPLKAKPPTLTGLFPPGAARGQSASVTMSGTFDHWPVKCWVDGEGLSVAATEKKGVLSIVVAPDAAPGVRWLRVYDQDGATSLRPFIVGALPETAEAEPNDDPRRPQKLSEPRTTINGRLARRGDVDGFAVDLKAGATLTADVEAARSLGSPMDGVLQVVSADGFVLAQNDDAGGLDPRIVFDAPSDGTYIVRLFAFPAKPDSSIRFAGGDDYIYRLTLTTDGFIDHAFPLAVPRESLAVVAAEGPNIPRSGPFSVLVASPGVPDRIALTHAPLAGAAEVRRVSGPLAVEAEINEPDHPQTLNDLASVSGRIDPPGDRDAYRIGLKKGETRRFRLESRAFGLPLDAVLSILGPTGEVLAETDDVGESKDPELRFSPKEDGEFRVVVRDLHDRGGPRFAYLLSVVRSTPDFSLTLANDVFEVAHGKETKVVVTIDRKGGFGGEIELQAEDLPAGVEVKPVSSAASGDSAKKATLEIRSQGEAASGPFRIVGRARGDGGFERTARAKIADFEIETERPWLTILPAPPQSKP
ncbi:PPC domain-containing protein [Paludisphaera rhizosphaerae]|uniref:PPC domain-containing protein n=1 Tax=Paludisphaera rhizosphaerae TaxID=2711216 RepID=UPI0013EDBC95|nr:PPC domain-containing protein [Paludisphaera rhizosphaerae]